ncbi:MAG TPA: alpha/beta hydrolase [Burkholderiales bacterium]
MSAIIYRGMTQAQLDADYNNTAAVPDVERHRTGWAERSARLRPTLDGVWDMPYGTKPRQRLDFIRCGKPGRPTYLHIHGGYWQRNEKEPFDCLALGLLSHGVNFANLEYTLAPEATMDEIVGEVAACTGYLLARLSELGADPTRLVVGGHSAGGHLTATLRAYPGVTGILPVSGLFDLEPIQLSYLNTALRMDVPTALRNSPIRHLAGSHPAIIVVGGAELGELQRQSRELHTACQARGLASELLVLPGEDHFSILEQLAAADGVLTQSVLKLLGEK